MGDFGREFGRDFARRGAGPGEERLPWLEPAGEDDVPRGRRLGLWLLAGLLVLAIAAVLAWWIGRRPVLDGPAGGPGLIQAPVTPYKVRPPEPGGMAVEGQGDTSYAASEGDDPAARIDLSATPETPIVAPKPARAAAVPQPGVPAPAATAPAPTVPSAPAAAGSAAVQLAALPSEARAKAAWTAMAGRFAFLAPFEHVITPVAVGDKTLYRLRVPVPSPAVARALCARLKVAGESCMVVG